MKRNIVNFIQFARGTEPRDPLLDLTESVRQTVSLLKKYDFHGTLLLQYDALIDPVYSKIVQEAGEHLEAGLWLEIVQPLAETAGIPWNGREGFVWDWHCHCGALIGYSPEERKKLIDSAVARFVEIFGYTPKVVGAWVLDAASLRYLKERYDIVAACNCKDQWGTDGYSLWGGCGAAYYPSQKNILYPAQTAENQIDVPVFRMLGSDVIYQYDAFLQNGAHVITLEPAYGLNSRGGGSDPAWVDWFFKENYLSNRGISLAYAQAGQENSFGWESVSRGLADQMEKIAKMRAEGKVEVLTLGETGEWYSSCYSKTPPNAQAALTDWKEDGRRSVWYYSSFYRVNLYFDKGVVGIRDCYLFDENYPERYLVETCCTDNCLFDNLPVWDGLLWSKGDTATILALKKVHGDAFRFDGIEYEENENSIMAVVSGEMRISFLFSPQNITIRSAGEEFCLHGDAAMTDTTIESKSENMVVLSHCGYKYAVIAEKGRFAQDKIFSLNGEIRISFKTLKQ